MVTASWKAHFLVCTRVMINYLIPVGNFEQWCAYQITTLSLKKYYDFNHIINNDSKIFHHAKLCQLNARGERRKYEGSTSGGGEKSTAAWNLISIEDGREGKIHDERYVVEFNKWRIVICIRKENFKLYL